MLGGMTTSIPSADDVRARLQTFGRAQLIALSERTGTPFTTLWKIRSGETADPRIDTVRAIWPELAEIPPAGPAQGEPAAAQA